MNLEVQAAWVPTECDYHGHVDRIGHSMLEVFRRSPALFNGYYRTKTIPIPEPTAAMRLGTLAHCCVLEPDEFSNRYVVAPNCDRRTKAGKAEYAAFEACWSGWAFVNKDDERLAWKLSAAVFGSVPARRLLGAQTDSDIEQPIYWTDETTGLPLKCRPDKRRGSLVIDLKFVRDPTPAAFARHIVRFGYHRAAAHYGAGVHELTGEQPRFVFIAVRTEPPHEVCCYDLDEEALILGSRQNRAALTSLAECMAKDEWRSPHEREIVTLSLPSWADSDEAWTFNPLEAT